jgi:biofilm protein TabA
LKQEAALRGGLLCFGKKRNGAEMILDHLSNASQYVRLHPGFASAFESLAHQNWAQQDVGRYPIVADRLYINVDETEGRGRDGAVLEAHQSFIDIQLTVGGCEEIGWRDLASCLRPRGAFDAKRDIVFYDEPPLSWVVVPPGYFAVFFPSDAHAPLAGRGPLKKTVAKVAAKW